jgi:hypothetical protein
MAPGRQSQQRSLPQPPAGHAEPGRLALSRRARPACRAGHLLPTGLSDHRRLTGQGLLRRPRSLRASWTWGY